MPFLSEIRVYNLPLVCSFYLLLMFYYNNANHNLFKFVFFKRWFKITKGSKLRVVICCGIKVAKDKPSQNLATDHTYSKISSCINNDTCSCPQNIRRFSRLRNSRFGAKQVVFLPCGDFQPKFINLLRNDSYKPLKHSHKL